MLQHLHIQNYALIEDLSIDFSDGFSVITGETGAGKSILLGALGFVLGDRADTGVLLDKNRKCIVEANPPTMVISFFRVRSTSNLYATIPMLNPCSENL